MKIGKIISIEYDKFRVKIFHTTRNSTISIDGRVYFFGNIGSYLKVLNSLGEYVLCEVVSIVDRTEDINKIYDEYNLDSSREIIVKPVGTLNAGNFYVGIGVFPSLYTDVEIVTYYDLNNILAFKGKNDNIIHSSIDIGQSKSLISYTIKLDINKFFNIHTAILGNTGSGKSTTIAHILQEIYHKTNNSARGAKTIIFDANGEYPIAFDGDTKFADRIERVFYKPNIKDEGNDTIYRPFILPYYLMNLDEWLSFLLASERTQKPFWDRVLQECYKFYKLFSTNTFEDWEKFANYIKWKLYKILCNLNSRVDSDTSKMTAAKSVIVKIKTICNNIEGQREIADEVERFLADLEEYLSICDKLCVINFGLNNNSLSDALADFVAKDSSHRYYICVSELKDGKGNVCRYETMKSAERLEECFLQIDEESALHEDSEKISSGEYYDCGFLKTAVEIVLLEEEARGNLRIREYVSTLMSRLDFFLYNPECDFMRMNKTYQDGHEVEGEQNIREIYNNTENYLEKVLGISDALGVKGKQLITIDSSEVGPETLELMTTVISRMIFDYRKKRKGFQRQKHPIHLILDEAHRYIHKDTDYIMRENIFEKIAREGRKYSLYLMVSSQRPSELSQTVLSQCGNYIVHRIQNEVDMKYIYSVLPYFSDDYVLKIKQAVPGEALIFGNCVPMPLMVKVTEAAPAPNSKNCEISEEWFNPQSSSSIEEEDDNG